MNEIFDDYKYKNISKRVGIKFKQKTCKILSPWEISSFISNFNTYYYKSEVMNTIGIALENGVNPKNIIIFDESFKLSNQYKNLNIINCNSNELQYLYTLGKPISLFPNKMIIFIHELFDNFRKINEFLYQANKKHLPIKTINKYYSVFSTEGKQGVIEMLRVDASLLLKNVKDQDIHKRFDKMISKMDKYANTIDENWSSINDIEHQLKSDDFKFVKTSNRLYQQYFRKFYSLLTNVPRPVIGVYHENNQKISLLCRAHFNKNERNAVTLDLKSISHNSPIEGLLVGGAAIYSTIKDEKRKDEIHEFNKNKAALETELKKEGLEVARKKNILLDLEIMEKQLNVLDKMAKIESSHEIDAVNQIEQPYIKQQMALEYSKLRSRSVQLMQKNNFEVDPKEIQIIDIKV